MTASVARVFNPVNRHAYYPCIGEKSYGRVGMFPGDGFNRNDRIYAVIMRRFPSWAQAKVMMIADLKVPKTICI